MSSTLPPTSDESKLIAAAQAGDASALEELLTRHQAQVYRFGLRLCRDAEDAQDVVQETLLASVRNLKGFRGASSFSTWLYTIARSFCIKKRRRRKHAPRVVVPLESAEAQPALQIPDPGRSPDEQLHERQVAMALERAVDSLAPAQRQVLVLRDMDGLPAAEVAQILGLTVEAVKSRLHRARAAVRAALSPLLGPAGAAPAPQPRTCPNIVRLFSRHLEGDLDSRVCARMERHLAGCPRCAGECESLKRTLSLCRDHPAPAVPAALQESVRQGVRRLLASK